ncbi:MATE family efflux transporter [Halocynthiibacter sp.]|uniref:MATE family efflux transporter n=1 Tax=Halocynthiibacter sp. TaxID=1979210 RepID=UPI003C66B7D4
MTYASHIKAVTLLGLPLVGSHLAQMAIGVTDTVMVGWYDVTSLAALTLASTFFFVIFVFGAGFGNAVMPMVAEASAAGDDTRVRRVTRMGLWASLGYTILMQPVFLWSEDILLLLGQTEEVAALGEEYLRIAGVGLIPALLVVTLKSYLSALERTGVVLISTIGAALLNIVMNHVLIFGNWGFPELGIRGAAIASVVNQFLPLIILAIYAWKKQPEHNLFARFWKVDGEALREVLRLGIPIGITIVAEVGLFAAASVMVGWFGTIELAAHGVALQLASVTFMVHLGLSGVATIRAGRAMGEKDETRLRMGGQVVLVMSFVFSLLTIGLFVAFPEPLVSLFLAEDEPARAEIMEIARVFLVLAALFQLADGMQAIGIGLLRGVQDTRIPMLMAAFGYWIVGVPSGYVISQTMGYGSPGVWGGLVIGLSVVAVLLNLRFWKRSWVA